MTADPALSIASPATTRFFRWPLVDISGETFGLFCGCLLASSASVSFAEARLRC